MANVWEKKGIDLAEKILLDCVFYESECMENLVNRTFNIFGEFRNYERFLSEILYCGIFIGVHCINVSCQKHGVSERDKGFFSRAYADRVLYEFRNPTGFIFDIYTLNKSELTRRLDIYTKYVNLNPYGEVDDWMDYKLLSRILCDLSCININHRGYGELINTVAEYLNFVAVCTDMDVFSAWLESK